MGGWVAAAIVLTLVTVAVNDTAEAATPKDVATALTASTGRLSDSLCFGGCPRWIALSGTIEKDSAQVVRAALDKNPGVQLVLLDSPGGNVNAAMAIGTLIRERRLDTLVARVVNDNCFETGIICSPSAPRPARLVSAICASACVNILAAGTRRAVFDRSVVGVHRYGRKPSDDAGQPKAARTEPLEDLRDPRYYADAERYFRRMGVDRQIVTLIRGTAHSDIFVLWALDMENLKLTTSTDSDGFLLPHIWYGGGEPRPVEKATPSRSSPIQRTDPVKLTAIIPLKMRFGSSSLGLYFGWAAEDGPVRLRAAIVTARTNWGSEPLILVVWPGQDTPPILVSAGASADAPLDGIIGSDAFCRLIGAPGSLRVTIHRESQGPKGPPLADGQLIASTLDKSAIQPERCVNALRMGMRGLGG